MEQDTDGPSAAFDGYESGRVGAPRTDNPYKADSAESDQWLAGWDKGSAKRDAVTPNLVDLLQQTATRNATERATSGTTESESTEPGEQGELAASKGEPPTANPYPADSAEAEEWQDGHDYVTSPVADETLPRPDQPPLRPEHTVNEKEEPSPAVTVPAAGED